MKRLTATQILILIPVLLFSGCWDQRVIEETGSCSRSVLNRRPGIKSLLPVFSGFR